MKPVHPKYQILFPGGEFIYSPLEGMIVDQVTKRTVILPEKRKFSLLSDTIPERKFSFSDFKPSCLTIYASHNCNLNCSYCYIPHKEKYPGEFISTDVVEAGARLVAESCRERRLPFVVGFHGGNEPLLFPDKIELYLKICELTARKNNLGFFAFCTTNGNIPEETAKWAAETFHGITLSWDGPPEFQNALRRDRSGKPTSSDVERSAHIFTSGSRHPEILIVRCTVTGLSVEHLEEILSYFNKAGVKTVEFYPVFQNRDLTVPNDIFTDPGKYVYHFLKARSLGRSHGMQILFSGSRITDLHGSFCSLLQDNLILTPDGFTTNCFFRTWNFKDKPDCFFYGKYSRASERIEFDDEALKQIMKVFNTENHKCPDCFNRFHCSHKCPGFCPFQDRYGKHELTDCTREKWLGAALLLESTGYLKSFGSEPECYDFFERVSSRLIS